METELSVIVLCYRAGKQTYKVVEEIRKLLCRYVPSWEIILVGNYIEGADDDTPMVVKDIASRYENITAIAKPKKGMMGWDARCGLDMAAGQYLCLTDGDEQAPAINIIKIFKKIKKEGLGLVKTYRKRRFDGITRIIISYVYNALFYLLFPGISTRDINSKPKIFTKEFYQKANLTSDD